VVCVVSCHDYRQGKVSTTVCAVYCYEIMYGKTVKVPMTVPVASTTFLVSTKQNKPQSQQKPFCHKKELLCKLCMQWAYSASFMVV